MDGFQAPSASSRCSEACMDVLPAAQREVATPRGHERALVREVRGAANALRHGLLGGLHGRWLGILHDFLRLVAAEDHRGAAVDRPAHSHGLIAVGTGRRGHRRATRKDEREGRQPALQLGG